MKYNKINKKNQKKKFSFVHIIEYKFKNIMLILTGQPGTPGLPGSVYQPTYQKPVSSNQYGSSTPFPVSTYPGSAGKLHICKRKIR